MLNCCHIGDCRDTLRDMIAGGVRAQMCVTSPPYWGLRDYGVDGQLGLEPTPAQYVANMVEVFALVREVLADDGVLWLNLGSSYASNGGATPGMRSDGIGQANVCDGLHRVSALGNARSTFKPKDMIPIPWMVAMALQADGWYLRSDIIWHKPNPMPESVTDRPTKSHEYLFLMAKQERYYYDAAAIREDEKSPGASAAKIAYQLQRQRKMAKYSDDAHVASMRDWTGAGDTYQGGRNRRTVWTIPTQPYAEAHFATFPPALIEPCILAGSRVGDTVLDPFFGSGTTGEVCERLGRSWIGCELNEDYVKLSASRTAQMGMAL